MLKKCCPHQGCKQIININESACELHKNYYDIKIRRGNQNKQYNDFYHTPEWLSMRNYALTYYNGLDVYALYAHDEILTAAPVHHIVEIKDDWNKRLDFFNLIPVSDISHSEIGKLYIIDKLSTQALLHEYLKRFKADYKAQN